MNRSIRGSLRAALVGCLACSAAVAAEPARRGAIVADSALAPAGFSRFWEARLPLSPGESIRAGYLLDEALYVATTEGRLFSLQADVGLLRWGEDLTEADFTIYHPAHAVTSDNTGPLIVPTTSQTYVLDRFNGAVLTRVVPEFAVGSPAVALGPVMYMGGANGRFYATAFDVNGRSPAVKMWEVQAGGPITAKPLLFGRESLVFASHSGAVFSCLASDKSLNWHYRTGAAITADPAVDASGVYVASTDRSLYKLSLGAGTVLWRARFPRPLTDGPVATGQIVYQYCAGEGLTALDAGSGGEKWVNADTLRLAARAGASDVLFTTDRQLLLVDRESGEIGSQVKVPGAADVVTNLRRSAVFLLGETNEVLCLKVDDSPYLRRQQILAAQRRLNQAPTEKNEAAPPLRPKSPEAPDPTENDPLRSRRDIPPR